MYEPSRNLKTFFIAGFQRYEGALVFDQLKIGASLDLVPEPENPYDPNAMELRYQGTKLGYVPREENELASLLAFYGHADVLEARIVQLDATADPWKQVRVALCIRDAR